VANLLQCIGCASQNTCSTTVQNRGAIFKSASRQRATISLTPVAITDLPGQRALRSASTSRLFAPPIKLSTVGSRAFPVAAAQAWNCLPEAIVSLSSLQTFRRQLKTHLFQLSYPHLIFWPFDWYRYSGPCSNVCYLGHSKNLCLLTYLLDVSVMNDWSVYPSMLCFLCWSWVTYWP